MNDDDRPMFETEPRALLVTASCSPVMLMDLEQDAFRFLSPAREPYDEFFDAGVASEIYESTRTCSAYRMFRRP